MKSHILIIILFGILFSIPMLGQEQADKFYKNLGYKKAIQLYRDGKLTTEVMEKMANSYRLNHDTQNAEKWFAQTIDLTSDPLNYLYYAQALHSNGKLAVAKEYYLKYDAAVGGSKDLRGRNLAEAIDQLLEFQSDLEPEVTNVVGINSPMLDYSPAFYEGGLVFVSNQKAERISRKKDLWTGDDYNTIFIAHKNELGRVSNPEVFETNLTKEFHEGPVSFSKAGDQIFFTRNVTQKTKNKEYVLQIYTAHKNSGVWGEQTKLNLGAEDFNDAHPSLAADGQTLYFASNRNGGFGGMDIWKSTFSAGNWSSPENLGSEINTPGNEVFPMIYDDGTLYFASDGHGGLGGLDIFYSEKTDEFSRSNPENLGTPFNSNKDDFGYILNILGTEGYFTSARGGGLGKDDIYKFSLPKPQSNKSKKSKPQPLIANICATDAENGNRLEGVKVTVLSEDENGNFTGLEGDFLLSLEPTENSDEFTLKLKRNDPFGDANENRTYFTDSKGSFELDVFKNRKYVLVATKNGYEEVRQEFEWNGKEEFCFPMNPTNCIALSGKVLNKEYNRAIPNATVQLINLCTGEMPTVKSDADGNYNFPCIECGCDFVLTGSKVNFKDGSSLATTTDRNCAGNNLGENIVVDLELIPALGPNGEVAIVSYKPSGEPEITYKDTDGNPVVVTENDPNLDIPKNAETLLENGIVIELKDIYYDFDEFYIRSPDANQDLDNLVAFMNRNPDIYVELRSHTDSRGTDKYNKTLAQNRAEAAVDYIVNRGIEPYRITAKGFGEFYLVNKCKDGIECSEEKHQLNRRTEVKVFKSKIHN